MSANGEPCPDDAETWERHTRLIAELWYEEAHQLTLPTIETLLLLLSSTLNASTDFLLWYGCAFPYYQKIYLTPDIWKLHLYIIIICVKVFEVTPFSKTNNHNTALGFRDIIPNVDIKNHKRRRMSYQF